MSYQPAWNAAFSKPLLNQVIAIIQRDQAAALAATNLGLLPINEFHKGPGLRTAYPWLTLTMEKITFDIASPWTRSWRAALSLILDVGQFDQELAQDNAQDYARLLDTVLTTASGSDWTTPLAIVHETVPGGMTSPPAEGSVKSVFIESHHYGLVSQTGADAPVMRVTLDVAFELQET